MILENELFLSFNPLKPSNSMKYFIVLSLFLGVFSSVSSQNRYAFQVKCAGPDCETGISSVMSNLNMVENWQFTDHPGTIIVTMKPGHENESGRVHRELGINGYEVVESTLMQPEMEKRMLKDAIPLITSSVRVAGNCDMCKKRIEQAARKIQGVYLATWNPTSELLTVKYDKDNVQLADIEKAIAAIGHTTEHQEADQKAYSALPKCCHYQTADKH